MLKLDDGIVVLIFILPLILIVADILLIRHGGRVCAIVAGCLNAVPVGLLLFLLISLGNSEWYVWIAWLIAGLLLDGLIIGWTLRFWNPRRLIVWSVCFVIAVAGVAGSHLYDRDQKQKACQRMMAAVGIVNHPKVEAYYSVNWIDPLQYKDGYEVIHLEKDRDADLNLSDIIPDSWTWEDVSIDDLSKRLHIVVDSQAIDHDSMSGGGYDCNAWFFKDNRSSDLPLDEREYYLGYYEKKYNVIRIYRGHHLHGLN